MRERRLKVPEDQQGPLQKLIDLDDAAGAALLAALQEAPAKLRMEDFAAEVARRAGLEKKDTTPIMEVLYSLYLSFDNADQPVDAFVDSVCSSAAEVDVKPKSSDWDPFKKWIGQVLRLDRTLGVAAKGLQIANAFPNTFCSVRIISDVRPIFPHDPATGPEGVVVVHQARIAFHPDIGRKHENFYVAMDHDDLVGLRAAIDRAIEKEKVLNAKLNQGASVSSMGESWAVDMTVPGPYAESGHVKHITRWNQDPEDEMQDDGPLALLDTLAVERPERLWRREAQWAEDSSRWILDLPERFDGENSPRYDPQTWDRAIEFVRGVAATGKALGARYLPSPEVLPGPEGSIDIHWQTATFEMLVNVPANPEDPVAFYGDDYGKSKLKGSNGPSESQDLVVRWILQR
jgi:hypothetical protein